MLILAVMASCWLLVCRGVALPIVRGISSSSAAPVVTNGDFGSSSSDILTFSSLSKNNSGSAVDGSSTAINKGPTYNTVKTRSDNLGATTPSHRIDTTLSSSSDMVNAIPTTSASTVSGYTSSTSGATKTTAVPDYALSFAELLSAITAEFVFNVAGDHVLFPVDEDRDADRRLHSSAIIVAELLQKLHMTPAVHRLLNASSCAVAEDMKRVRRSGANPVAEVLRLTTDALEQDAQLRDEYLAAKQRLANQIFALPAQHGKFASSRSQTLYEVTGEQLAYAESLMEDARVKKLMMSVTLYKASQFEEASVPEWVRSQTHLARALFELAQRPKLRDEVQKVFDETVAECTDRFDAMAGDDEVVFQTLRQKFERNAPLSAELKKMGGQFAQTNT